MHQLGQVHDRARVRLAGEASQEIVMHVVAFGAPASDGVDGFTAQQRDIADVIEGCEQLRRPRGLEAPAIAIPRPAEHVVVGIDQLRTRHACRRHGKFEQGIGPQQTIEWQHEGAA